MRMMMRMRMRMRVRYLDDFIEHLWNTCYRKTETEGSKGPRLDNAAQDNKGPWGQQAASTSASAEDVDEAEDEAVAVNRICMGALSISHLQRTTSNLRRKRREEKDAPVPDLSISCRHWDTEAIMGESFARRLSWKKRWKKKKETKWKAADERTECDHKCHREKSGSWQTNENREPAGNTWLMALIGLKPVPSQRCSFALKRIQKSNLVVNCRYDW